MKRTLIANLLFWVMILSIISMYAFIGFKIAGLTWSFFWIIIPFCTTIITLHLIRKYYRDVFVSDRNYEAGNNI
jgi:hypothetical protein